MTPLFKKLNYKDQSNIVALNAPKSFDIELTEMSKLAEVYKSEKEIKLIEFAIAFATKQTDVDEAIEKLFPKLSDDAVLWFCYPKMSSKKYKCEFNRDTGWSELGKRGLETVRAVAVDEDWSALRFRKTEYVKKMTRKEGHALSEAGRERVNQKRSKKL